MIAPLICSTRMAVTSRLGAARTSIVRMPVIVPLGSGWSVLFFRCIADNHKYLLSGVDCVSAGIGRACLQAAGWAWVSGPLATWGLLLLCRGKTKLCKHLKSLYSRYIYLYSFGEINHTAKCSSQVYSATLCSGRPPGRGRSEDMEAVVQSTHVSFARAIPCQSPHTTSVRDASSLFFVSDGDDKGDGFARA